MDLLDSTHHDDLKPLYDYRNIQIRHPLPSQRDQRELGIKYQIYLKISDGHETFGNFKTWDFAEACRKLFGKNFAFISDYTSVAQNPYALGVIRGYNVGPNPKLPDWYHSSKMNYQWPDGSKAEGFTMCYLTTPEQLTMFVLGYGDKFVSY